MNKGKNGNGNGNGVAVATASQESIRSRGSLGDDGIARMTIVIPSSMDQNLQVLSLKVGCTKNDVIKTALRAYLISQGLQPDSRPKIDIRY
jgi:hypothetical protein